MLKSLVLVLTLTSLLLVGCGEAPEDELAGTWYVHQLHGRGLALDVTETRTFNDDGTLVIERSDMPESHTVAWSIVGEWRMRIDAGEDSQAPPNDYLYRIDQGVLTIGSQTGDIVLTREQTPVGDLLDLRRSTSPPTAEPR